MEAQNTGNTSAADAAADRAANIDSAIWSRMAEAGALAPRVSPTVTPLSRPETISETGARLAREDAAKKGQPVHQTGTRPVAQQTQQEDQNGESQNENQQEQVQPQHGEGHQLEVPIRNSREDWTTEVSSFGQVTHAGGVSAEVSQHIVDFVNDETPKNSPMLGGDGWGTDRVISHLRQEWGDSFNERMAAVNKAATSDPRLEAWLDNTGAGNSPAVLQLLAAYGKDPHFFNPATAQSKIDRIMNDQKYWAGDRQLRFEASFLFKIAAQQK